VYYREALSLRQELGDKRGVAISLWNLAATVEAQGDEGQAATLYHESLRRSWDIMDKRGIVFGLSGIAGSAASQGQPERVARLAAAAEVLREAIDLSFDTVARAIYDRAVAAARAQLGEVAFATAWAAGQAMSLDQAIAEALADISPTET